MTNSVESHSNSRFLIPAHVSVRGLASKILSLAARHLSKDWERLYGYRPLLLETLVERGRFRGTCYKAANWIHLGCTQGRGRMFRTAISPPDRTALTLPLKGFLSPVSSNVAVLCKSQLIHLS